MQKRQIKTAQAPAAIGPYSQGISTGNMVFISGQLPLQPETGEMVTGTISEQTDQVMRNVRSVAEAAGSSLAGIVKTTIFLTDLRDFQEVNRVYGAYFTESAPARSTIQVAALPLGARIEIEAIALVS